MILQFNQILRERERDIPENVCPDITVSCDAQTAIMKLPGNVLKQDFIEKYDHNSTVLNLNYKNSLTTKFT